MINDDEVNVRRHPRTMNEAFPGSPEYACSIEVCNSNKWELIVFRCLIGIGVVSFLVAVFR